MIASVSGFKLSQERDVGVTPVVVLRRAPKSLIAYLPLVQFPKRKSSLFEPRLITDMDARLLNNRDHFPRRYSLADHFDIFSPSRHTKAGGRG